MLANVEAEPVVGYPEAMVGPGYYFLGGNNLFGEGMAFQVVLRPFLVILG